MSVAPQPITDSLDADVIDAPVINATVEPSSDQPLQPYQPTTNSFRQTNTITVEVGTDELTSNIPASQSVSAQSLIPPHRQLYELCKTASAIKRPPSTLTERQAAQAAYEASQSWDEIRFWFDDNPDQDERFTAVRETGDHDTIPLHLICKAYDPPVDIIEMFLSVDHGQASIADAFEWLPLHYACGSGARKDVLERLIAAYPDARTKQDKRERTPLHFALGRGNRFESAEEFAAEMNAVAHLLCDSGAPRLPDENGMLPLHYACAFGADAEVVSLLGRVFPESITSVDKKGRTALHFCMGNASKDTSPGVVELLLNLDTARGHHLREGDRLVNKVDGEDNLPLNLIANQARHLQPEPKSFRDNTIQCLHTYLDNKPQPISEFLTGLQTMPDWLCDRAVVNPNVQAILNEKISQRFPTSVLFLDGFFLLLIIIFFWLATREYIKHRFQNTTPPPKTVNLLVPLYFGSTYFLVREVVQILSLLALGALRTWFMDFANWLDIALITLVIYFTLSMRYDLGDDRPFRTGVALTIGILWCSVIIYLKSTLVDFAVFVGGVQYVFRRLAAFMLALSIILILFAQMFVFIYKNTPEKCWPVDVTPPNFAHCDFRYSLLRVYSMLMGEVDMMDYVDSNISKFLYTLFAFLVVILLSNVLIAIVTDSYGVIKNERAAMVFWNNRLDFVAEMNAIQAGPWRKKEQKVTRFEDPHEKKPIDPLRKLWDSLMSIYEEDYGYNYLEGEFWLYMAYRLFTSLIIIPLWLGLGAASAGWLWPPQVRERLLVQRTSTLTRADLTVRISKQVAELIKDVEDLKLEVKGEMQSDRRLLGMIMNEAEKAHREAMADMQEVRNLMQNILDQESNGGQMGENTGRGGGGDG